jgi:hypothetical protein
MLVVENRTSEVSRQRMKQYHMAIDITPSAAPWIAFFTTESEATLLLDAS